MASLLGGGLLLAAVIPGREARALSVTAVTSDNGYPAHEVDWTDADGLPRSAVLVDQNDVTAPFTGYLRRYTYQVNGQPRVCTGTENYAAGGNLEFSGDGFVQNHTADGGDYSSGNGAGVPGTTAVTLQGSSHAIITFDMQGYVISGQNVPTTVQWFFADGRSNPVFSVSQDARVVVGNLGADSRTPYGDMAYDGDGVDALVGGFSYGDTFKFVTLAANPERVTSKSGWIDIRENTIPYAMQWVEPATADAEMGHVATLPISLSDQGADTQTSQFDNPPDLFDPREQQMLSGPLPAYNTFAYQIINDNLVYDGSTTDIKRLAWGANPGRVGGFDNYGDATLNITQYSQHSTDPINQPLAGTRADGRLMAYSTFIVLGQHQGSYAAGATGQEVADMEAAAGSTLAVATGTAATSGPAGVGNASAATITYTPAGYNPTYAAWEISAAGNTVSATLTPPAGGSLDHPVFVIDGYTSATVPTVTLNGAYANISLAYLSLDTDNQRVWVTINEPVTAALDFQLSEPAPGSTPTPTPTPTPTVSPTPAPTPTPTPTPTPGGLPVVSIAATVPVAHADEQVPGLFTFSISAAPAVKTVVHYLIKGSAVNGQDYVYLTGKAKIKPGHTSASVQVVPQSDLAEGEVKAVKLVVEPASTFTIGGSPQAKVKIKP